MLAHVIVREGVVDGVIDAHWLVHPDGPGPMNLIRRFALLAERLFRCCSAISLVCVTVAHSTPESRGRRWLDHSLQQASEAQMSDRLAALGVAGQGAYEGRRRGT